ncbi:hypothetical protein D9C01_01515 [Corynebacterium diphtheriae]|nr:hypothetical protein D9C01_01515 [Corynebacterium diphtheriae]
MKHPFNLGVATTTRTQASSYNSILDGIDAEIEKPQSKSRRSIRRELHLGDQMNPVEAALESLSNKMGITMIERRVNE